LESRVAVKGAGGEAEKGGHGRIGLARHAPEGVVNDVVGDGCDAGFSVVKRQVADRVEVVGQGPQNRAGAVEFDLFVGQNLVDGGAPEVAVGDLALGADLENDLVAVVDEVGAGRLVRPLAVGID
jgi:hypothetical protein